MKLDRKQMMINEARILGHAEAKNPQQKAAATALVKAGKLTYSGNIGTNGRGGKWYKLSANAAPPTTLGPKVRFTVNGLGASEANNLGKYVRGNDYGTNDVGIVAFEHPNVRACACWVYIEVDSKTGPARSLYVAVSIEHIEPTLIAR
jgi:hypothetical protein